MPSERRKETRSKGKKKTQAPTPFLVTVEAEVMAHPKSGNPMQVMFLILISVTE